ncbi:heme ABC transporter ATP-binding protein [Maritimibacter dapengensis]|uniref:Heme ABC transporter ATP-binding protein n=1 Tax=Maritimibacter dapengensis TaxID=2836868 RepID=A0ABS6SYH1_9RHOB|nr:heme ABC transporter ATP-binding protein [Maritimibacter dapengensis]MBV7378007.1 heme ABC transporter ATP-binding protein [Maritimibacter dapengensis]
MLTARNLTVHLGHRQILHGVDFTAKAGEVTAIVGPNGSGKTTLLRAITGDVGYTGDARIEGLDVARAKPWELAARRGVLSQFTGVAFPFTVAEIVRLGQSNGISGGGPDLGERALARVGLSGFGHRPYHDLSGGEQQRTQLARVLAQVWDPTGKDGANWLILDEPVASLDIAHQLEVMTLARDFALSGGGVVAVMHDLNLTAMFAQSVALMAEGRVVTQGDIGHVFTDENLSAAYACDLKVNTAPANATYILPHAASA